jgi:hypothetical protein
MEPWQLSRAVHLEGETGVVLPLGAQAARGGPLQGDAGQKQLVACAVHLEAQVGLHAQGRLFRLEADQAPRLVEDADGAAVGVLLERGAADAMTLLSTQTGPLLMPAMTPLFS